MEDEKEVAKKYLIYTHVPNSCYLSDMCLHATLDECYECIKDYGDTDYRFFLYELKEEIILNKKDE